MVQGKYMQLIYNNTATGLWFTVKEIAKGGRENLICKTQFKMLNIGKKTLRIITNTCPYQYEIIQCTFYLLLRHHYKNHLVSFLVKVYHTFYDVKVLS